ncbi:hypothetical protein SDC9_163414 [bioreactor metagenome]|uniref:Lipopolysaccharide assembly protein A domain-containing protein n=1 Tax=bioreactor metagenome TaxID=1076179 RepID=A0A645FQT9_9ZZZZ
MSRSIFSFSPIMLLSMVICCIFIICATVIIVVILNNRYKLKKTKAEFKSTKSNIEDLTRK